MYKHNSWEGIHYLAEKEGTRYPELVAAQWQLESGGGEHASGKHNYFGLKGSGTLKETEEETEQGRISELAEFMDFNTIANSVKYLITRWYKDWDKYEGVDRASTIEEAAEQLQTQGYATDSEYAAKLLKIIHDKRDQSVEASPMTENTSIQLKPDLFKMEAIVDTFLKKAAVQSSDLPLDEKVFVNKGRVCSVVASTEIAADSHCIVELDYSAGQWFVFKPHWKLLGAPVEPSAADDYTVDIVGLIDWSDFSSLVTPNLTVGEILQWDSRRIPPANGAVRSRIIRTAHEFEAIRRGWKHPLGVSSFYRPEPINSAVGGVPGSQHTQGTAIDIYPVDGSVYKFYDWIRRRWTGGLGDGRARGFIHLDTRRSGGFVPGAGVRPAVSWTY